MAVQQNKVTPARRNKRRSHDALLVANWIECSNCGEPKLRHHVCVHCGTYRNRQILILPEEPVDEEI